MAVDTRAIETHSSDNRRFAPSAEFSARARIPSKQRYLELYEESLASPEQFWRRETSELVFRKPFEVLCEWTPPYAKWFGGGELNVQN